MIMLYLGYLWYLKLVLLNWQTVSEGKLWIGATKLLVPFSVNIVIHLLLKDKIKLWIPGLKK